MRTTCIVFALALALSLAPACAPTAPAKGARTTTVDALAPATARITSDALLAHIRTLASDAFEGRAPGTHGEDVTTAYIAGELAKTGAKPGNQDGTYFQSVPLRGGRVTASSVSLSFGTASANANASANATASKTLALSAPTDVVLASRPLTPKLDVDASEIVFVGYGTVAPEYAWDDFKGTDVRGKTLVMLVNDPQVPDPRDASKLDDALFKGRAMTWYGRYPYKWESGATHGAAAVILVHETAMAGYGWEVVESSFSKENFEIAEPAGASILTSWIHVERAKELFAAAGKDFEAMKRAAASRDFRPVPLGGRASFHLETKLRDVQSKNVVGQIDGADPAHRDEYVVYTAHWDHLGKDPSVVPDSIYNGAVDNASGVASLLTIADAYAHLPAAERPKRTILFLAVTAEEKGLLGAKYYATHPLHPLAQTLCALNMDALNPWGRAHTVNSVTLGHSSLDAILIEEAARQGRVVTGDPLPERGHFYRSDHFELVKQGVPAVVAVSDVDYLGRAPEWGRDKREQYVKTRYHKPTDQVDPEWDLRGMAEDATLLFRIGLRVARSDAWPEWNAGSEFAATRAASQRGAPPAR